MRSRQKNKGLSLLLAVVMMFAVVFGNMTVYAIGYDDNEAAELEDIENKDGSADEAEPDNDIATVQPDSEAGDVYEAGGVENSEGDTEEGNSELTPPPRIQKMITRRRTEVK